MTRSTLATILVLALLGLATAWNSGYGYYDRYNVAPMRADQDSLGFGSLFESNRRSFANSRMNTNGEYVRGYRDDGMGYYPRNDNYGGGYGGYGGYDNGRQLARYRPGRNQYYNGYDYDYGYNGGGYGGYGRNRDYYGGGGYGGDYGYGSRYNRGYNRYNNNDYWSNSRSYGGMGGYGPNNDSYRYY